MERVDCVMEEVDAHNIVPVWVASDKKEFAARTIRPKINSKLNDYLTDFPPLKPIEKNPWPEMCLPEEIPWETHLETVLERGKDVPEVDWIVPGEDAAREALSYFLEKERLGIYAAKRNDPTANGQSGLSPYFHFGFLSAQRAAFEVQKLRHRYKYRFFAFLLLKLRKGIGRWFFGRVYHSKRAFGQFLSLRTEIRFSRSRCVVGETDPRRTSKGSTSLHLHQVKHFGSIRNDGFF